jgi:dihydroxyacetone kinase-like predicted kinase
VTVLYGDEVTEENANIIFEKMKAEMPDAEFSLLYGGQPLYDFVISVE